MNEKEFVNFIKKSLNETSQLILISTKLKDIKKWDSLSSVRVLLELSKKMGRKSHPCIHKPTCILGSFF